MLGTDTHGKTPQQLADEGHWNGEIVEGAHERLFERVDYLRVTRRIALADAIAVVHADIEGGHLSPALASCVDIYRRWRAERLGTAGISQRVSLAEFAFWMQTGQFAGPGVSAATEVASNVIKLVGADRQASFAGLMARMDGLVKDQGLSVVRAAGQLVNEAMLSDAAAPCALRSALAAAMGRGGRHGVSAGPAAGLPSVETIRRWYLKHRSGAVVEVGAKSDAQPARRWVSRESRWLAEALAIKASNADLQPVAVHAELLRRWRHWWGAPVGRDEFLRKFEQQGWTL